jgi:hypothetical protein
MTIYAIALGSRDGDTATELKMASSAKAALEAVKELASKHIAYVLAGEDDAQQFVDGINEATSIDQAVSGFATGMQEAHDRRVENAYSAELVLETLEV